MTLWWHVYTARKSPHLRTGSRGHKGSRDRYTTSKGTLWWHTSSSEAPPSRTFQNRSSNMPRAKHLSTLASERHFTLKLQREGNDFLFKHVRVKVWLSWNLQKKEGIYVVESIWQQDLCLLPHMSMNLLIYLFRALHPLETFSFIQSQFSREDMTNSLKLQCK